MDGKDLDRICHHPILSSREEKALAKKAFKGDKEAQKKLVLFNLRLVASIAKGFVTNHNSLGDCIGIGVTGLIKAAERFDPSRGTKFSTYATWWIKEALLKANWAQESPIVRVPNWIGGLDKKEREGQHLTEKEKFYLERADSARRSHSNVYELNDRLTPQAPPEEPPLYGKQHHEVLSKAVARLHEKDAQLLRARFGLPPHKRVATLQELSVVEGVSPSEIRNRQARALDRLRAVFDELASADALEFPDA